MLVTLRVKNLALVEQARVDFEPGLNVVTGETGAGKSILIGALNLLLGERADRKWIRSGEDTCGAEALFQLQDAGEINALLESCGASPCEDGQLIIRRLLKANGNTQNLVNDSAVTQQVLKKIGDLLVDMHGPHDHQSLLRPAFQLSLLDAYGQTASALSAYQEKYGQLQGLRAQRAELEGAGEGVQAQIELLTYRVKELEGAGLTEEEEASILKEHTVTANAQRILELGNEIAGALTEGEASAFDLSSSALRNLEELARLLPDAVAWKDQAHGIAVQVKDLGETVRSTLEGMEANPARLEWLEQRMAVYQKLKRKYGGTTAEALAQLAEAKAKLHGLQHRGEELAKLAAAIAKGEAELLKLGAALTRLREAASGRLAKEVAKELRALGFPSGEFAAALSACPPGPAGVDQVEFGFAPNKGEPMKPLRDIASSGEMSRVMLAIKAVLAEHDKIPVLVFDEVDANIGGETGSKVGRKLAELGRHHQVICITHLPQVAVCGTFHAAVAKSEKGGRTFTEVTVLDPAARVHEIARMLGGKDMTKVTLQHAREMLEAGKK